ncbi:hypothetical protein DIPPA_26770 [Diplonema papillatum]|nr:hypothetical protein DIPPA_26770 [Diplonema papillatum]
MPPIDWTVAGAASVASVAAAYFCSPDDVRTMLLLAALFFSFTVKYAFRRQLEEGRPKDDAQQAQVPTTSRPSGEQPRSRRRTPAQ